MDKNVHVEDRDDFLEYLRWKANYYAQLALDISYEDAIHSHPDYKTEYEMPMINEKEFEFFKKHKDLLY